MPFFSYYSEKGNEGKPFSKDFRTWSYKAAKNNNLTEAFGSNVDENELKFSFVNSPYPHIPNKNDMQPNSITYGEDTENPYTSNSRVNISAMSYGALSSVAVLSLSMGAKKGGFLMNTGEGGLSKFHKEGGADIIYQIGTAKYGCDNDDLTLNIDKLKELAKIDQIKMFEIKLSQGAKPGKGGILPAEKVTKEIAEARGIPVGTASISPNRHVEVTDEHSLLTLIENVKVNSKKPTGIKFCLGAEEHFDSLIKAMVERSQRNGNTDCIPSFITIDSSDGGTGAAPSAHMDAMGMNIEESLPIVRKILTKYNLRDKIKIIVSGKLGRPMEAGWAFAMGADAVNIGRGFLFSLGCIQARECNKNKCPTGITTHKKRFTKGLVPQDKYIRVYNYHKNLTKELLGIAHSCGVKCFSEMNEFHVRQKIKIKMVE